MRECDWYSGAMFAQSELLKGTLHIFVAFDWGEEVDLDHARRLLPAELQDLARRRRTPSSVAYRPAPLRYPLSGARVTLPEVGEVTSAAEAIVFDFGGVSVSLQTPFELSAAALSKLASSLADAQPLVDEARRVSMKLFETLKSAMQQPRWSPLNEEYFVFQIESCESLAPVAKFVERDSAWLAQLVRLESEALSDAEISAQLQSQISYSLNDLLLAAFSAAVLVDRDCEETLQTIEFANLQLLEYRFIDNLLDERLAGAYSTIHRTLQSWLPFWRTHGRPLRQLGELRIDVNRLFERTGNALKLVGDQYLARVYRLVAQRFHLAEWEQSIRASLDVVEGAYQVVSDQSATFRVELLEMIVIVLIALEIVLALVRH
jgi:hypothetical protein